MTSNKDFYSKESFHKNGFIIIEDVLKKKEVSEIRDTLFLHFKELDKSFENISYVLESELAKLQFNDKILKSLRSVIGEELVLVNDFNVQFNAYGVEGRNKGLHADCNSEFTPKNKYLFSKEYQFGKVGIYFQDNTESMGGGIDVLVGSHKTFTKFRSSLMNYLYSRLFHKFHRLHNKRKIRVPIKAGSAVYFDSRLLHSSSSPRDLCVEGVFQPALVNEITADMSKYTIYWEVCKPGNEKPFLKNSYKRALLEQENGSEDEKFFSEYTGFSYPEDYPSYYRSLVEKNNLSVASLKESLDINC